jgi:hypothetical protein
MGHYPKTAPKALFKKKYPNAICKSDTGKDRKIYFSVYRNKGDKEPIVVRKKAPDAWRDALALDTVTLADAERF